MKIYFAFLFLHFAYSSGDQLDFTPVVDDGLPRANINFENKTIVRESRISYGNTAYNGQFPYMARLLVWQGDRATSCGGTLVKSNHLFTAKHCLPDGPINLIEVWLGSIDRNVEVTKAYGEAYMGHHSEDIAVIRLSSHVNYQIAQLPSRWYTNGFNYFDKKFQVIGFGRDQTGKESRYLMWTWMTALNIKDCGTNNDKILCMEGEGWSETGPGDSGSALLYGNVLVGIDSYGIGSTSNMKTGFVRMDKIIDWLSDRIEVPIY